MFKPKSNSNVRKAPTEVDDVPLKQVLEFDCTRPWPERYFGQAFGPALIQRALKSGLIVVAEIDDIPYPVMIKEARWCNSVLEVMTLEGPRIPSRLFTRKSVKGMTTSGLLMEEKETG